MRKSKSKDVSFIGGYSAAKAIKRARSHAGSHAPAVQGAQQKASGSAQKQEKPQPERRKARIGSTAIPSRTEVVCYECGYTFTLQGSAQKAYCAKCRNFLDRSDHTISQETTESTRTVGAVLIEKNAVLKDVSIVARNIALSGDAALATLQASDTLQLNKHARFDITRIQMTNLSIGAGADITIDRSISCGNLEILGRLKADIKCTGITRISSNGVFVGRLNSHRLIIEDGARLEADLHAARLCEAIANF